MKLREIYVPLDGTVEMYPKPVEKEIAVKAVQAYVCPGCRRVYLNKLSAIRHANKCLSNPNNKTCFSCVHRISLSANNVEREDKCHCVIPDGENLVEKVKWHRYSYGDEDYECQYTGHDIVWDCKFHRHGRGWIICVDNYDSALDVIYRIQKQEKGIQ